jgi:hypothetical protein
MLITDVKPNQADPKAKTEIEGIITKIVKFQTAEGTKDFLKTDYGIKQNVLCSGTLATFFSKTPLLTADLNKPMKLMCKASIYNNQLQYSLFRISTGGGKYSGRNWIQEAKEKNRSVGLNYALDKNLLGLPYGAEAFKRAIEMAEFMETGKMPLFAQVEALGQPSAEDVAAQEVLNTLPQSQEDDIPF